MSDPRLPLQHALAAALKAGVPAVSNRVYDAVPDAVVFPFIAIGEIDAIDDGADCVDGFDVAITLHVWSRAVGSVEAGEIAAAIRAALHGLEPDLSSGGFASFPLEHRGTRTLRDPDGKTTHGIVTLRALIEAVTP